MKEREADTPANLTGTSVILNVSAHPKISHKARTEPTRLHAHAVKRILDRQSGAVVGWLYEWNTGELVPRWKAEARTDVVYV